MRGEYNMATIAKNKPTRKETIKSFIKDINDIMWTIFFYGMLPIIIIAVITYPLYLVEPIPIAHESKQATFSHKGECNIQATDAETFRELAAWCQVKVISRNDLNNTASPNWKIPEVESPAR